MKFNKVFIVFGLAITIHTFVFHYFLSLYLDTEQWNKLLIANFIYAGAMFVTGWTSGYNASRRDFRGDLGFQSHFITYLICNITWVIWLSMGLGSGKEKWWNIAVFAGVWGMGLLGHYYSSRRTIKGYSKASVFE